MMIDYDYLEIGPAPCEEDCAQVGTDDYTVRARLECRRYIAAIRKVLGPEPEGAHLCVKSNPHDFGTYLEVVVRYETENEAACAYAVRCESDAPTTWPEGV